MLGCDPYGFYNLFHEKGLGFCGLKIVVHLGFGHSFIPEMVLMILGVVDL